MMKAVIEDFEQRAKDIRSYLRMLERMDDPRAVLRRRSGGRHHSVAVEENWRVIAKATAYLLIYNLVESAVRSGLDQLYLAVRNDECTCEHLSDSLRSVWIDQKHRAVRHESASPVNYRQAASDLVKDIVQKRVVNLSAEEIPGAGSLDAREIRKVCEKHNMSLKVHRNARGGASLVIVKAQRNALAHGEKSFAECGRDVTLDDLKRTAKETELYVRGFLRSLDRFIAKKSYLVPASTP